MIPLLNVPGGGGNVRLLRHSANDSISRTSNTAESLTCASSVDATEIFIAPAGALVNPGDYLLLEIVGRCFNNDGASRNLQGIGLVGATTVITAASGVAMGNVNADRYYRLQMKITYSGASAAVMELYSYFAGASTSGTVYGSFAAGTFGSVIAKSFTFNPAIANTIIAKSQWNTTTNVYCNPFLRTLTAVRY